MPIRRWDGSKRVLQGKSKVRGILGHNHELLVCMDSALPFYTIQALVGWKHVGYFTVDIERGTIVLECPRFADRFMNTLHSRNPIVDYEVQNLINRDIATLKALTSGWRIEDGLLSMVS